VSAVAGADKDRGFCTACFTGRYPTGITRRDLARMEAERKHWSC
jgi:glutamine phosphoribosylpyrophosphate amidotransferase